MNRAERRTAARKARRGAWTINPSKIKPEFAQVTVLLLDPGHAGSPETARITFGEYGEAYLKMFSQVMAGDQESGQPLVLMVGRPGREPARVGVANGDHLEAAVDAAFQMAKHLGDKSLWLITADEPRRSRLLELAAVHSECVGGCQ